MAQKSSRLHFTIPVLCESGAVSVELIQSEPVRTFVDLVDGVPQVMAAVKDIQGKYVYVNSGFCDRLGLNASSILGRTLTDLFPDDLADSYRAQDELVLGTGRPMRHHLELIVRADGSLGWYVTSKTPTHDPRGIIVLSIDLHSQMNSAHQGLAEVIAAVRTHVHLPWRVSELAQIAGLSTPTFERLCRKTLGIPPQKLIQRLRIEHAVQLITSTDLTLGQVSAECGFYDQSSFTRQFRSVLGLTPGAYRMSG